ncbi:hypothetical protein [Paracerasibacillus soli]|uniref:Uncharacterized protein n=1 Tax=Paracerasibacillus soli TaxID=480284 RepID=A0ABU5CWC1_9BACI|nr:hypothetical protein [Virgibacillus soli]MDY0410676.1 hypothetical protein [Virgibacillus soli]
MIIDFLYHFSRRILSSSEDISLNTLFQEVVYETLLKGRMMI